MTTTTPRPLVGGNNLETSWNRPLTPLQRAYVRLQPSENHGLTVVCTSTLGGSGALG